MRLTLKLATAIFAIVASAGALATSGTSAAQSGAVPELVVVWSGFWTGPRLIPDIIVYSDGEVIYRDEESAPEQPSIANWLTVTIDEDTRQKLIAEVQQGLQKSENCNVFAPVADDGPAPTIYLSMEPIRVFPVKLGPSTASDEQVKASCAEFQKMMGKITALKSLPARAWHSKTLEFEIYPTLKTLESAKPIQWPLHFPIETHETTIGWGNFKGTVLTIRVPQSTDVRNEATQLWKLSSTKDVRGESLLIAGKQYRLYDVHEGLPGQGLWEEAIYRAWDENLP